jgi:hypothetical protein
VWVNQNGLKLNGTHQFLVYAHDVNILDGSVHTIKKNTEAVIIISKETGLEVSDEDTKYMIRSRGQNAVRSHNIKTVKEDSHIACRAHAAPMPFPCHAVR